jgi:hypothetical protein
MHRDRVMPRCRARIFSVALAAVSCSSNQLQPPPSDGSSAERGAPPDAGSVTDAVADSGMPLCPTPAPGIEASATPFVSCSQPDSTGRSFETDVTVLGWDSGLVGCLAPLAQSFPHLAAAARLLRVRTAAGAEQSFGMVLPGLSPPIQIGDTVHLLYEHEPGGFSPTYSRFELRNAAGLVLYIGLGGRPDRMKTSADIQLGLGKQLCATVDCGPWGLYELDVSIQGQAMTRSFAPNTSARVGDYLVVVGASEQQTAGSSTCADWYVSRTEIGIASLFGGSP